MIEVPMNESGDEDDNDTKFFRRIHTIPHYGPQRTQL
jgi:hypothetical protein